MDHQDIRTLKIIEELDKEQVASQRDLARELNISLGLVNSFIKRLVNKGYFKITNIPANRVKYILTPKGAAEKTRLTYEYIQYSYQFYKGARTKLRQLFEELARKKVRNVVFYGASDQAEIAYLSLQEFSMELVAVVDEEKEGGKFFGKKVLPVGALPELSCDVVIITLVGSVVEVLESLVEQGIVREKILTLN